MKRRHFIGRAAAGAVLGAGVAGCNEARQTPVQGDCDGGTYKWKMVTAWPKNFPGLGVGAERLAAAITAMSGGRIEVKVYGAGELVPALEVFDAVRGGVAELGHSAAYYWQGKDPAFSFFTAVPFGMTAEEINAWFYQGGGLRLWEEFYRPFGLVPFPAGNTGMQMAGWFNRKIEGVEDFAGLKMRIPGMGGRVIEKLGGVAVNLPGGELFTAMQTGTIDATEWATPYNDLAFGLYKVARYYYYPGWQEPGAALECIVNAEAFDALPESLRAIVAAACHVANSEIHADYVARNDDALKTLVNKHGVELLRLPDEVLERLRGVSAEVVRQSVASSAAGQRLYAAYREFQDKVAAWSKVSSGSYFAVR